MATCNSNMDDFPEGWNKFLLWQMFANLALVAIIALIIISNMSK